MYGQPPRFRLDGRGPAPPPPPQFNSIYHQNPNFYFANPNPIPPLNQFLQTPNFQFQNPNFQFQNPTFPIQKPNAPSINPNETLEMVDRAVEKARSDLLAAGESVSTWKVRQSALVILKIDSWDSLGFQMQEVPSLYRLMVTEGKINAFIHCFVGVRKITSLYDLELAICKNEGTEKFEELDMGPLLRHPLVLQYFGASSEVKDVFKITSEEIISLLSKFIRKKKHYDITADDLLNYIAKKKSVDRTEFLCVRIRNLVMHISYIQQGWNSEQNAIKNYLGDGHTTSGKKSKKRPDSSHKEQLDENSGVASQRIGSNTSTQKKSCGKHIRFSLTGSEDISNTSNNDKDYRDENIPQNSCSYLPQNASSDRVSSCPYPSMAEEIRRLGLKSEAGPSLSLASSTLIQNKRSKQLKRKRESENSSVGSPPQQLPKKHNAEAHDLINNKKYNFSIVKKKQMCLNQINEVDLERDTNSIRMFISTWKEACQENNVTQVLDMMIEFYGLNKGKKVKEIFMQKPCAELVNVAVEAIKSELSDKMYGTSQTPNQHVVANPISGNNTVMDQLSLGIGNVEENVLTGRLGELVAFKYFSGKYGGTCVKWVNETHESGFPYDIAVGDEEMSREYIEVKATKTDRKDWFNITAREWQFAIEKGECFSIARVTLQCNDMAKVTIYKNPARLCQLGQLQLAMLIPRQQHSKEFSVVP